MRTIAPTSLLTIEFLAIVGALADFILRPQDSHQEVPGRIQLIGKNHIQWHFLNLSLSKKPQTRSQAMDTLAYKIPNYISSHIKYGAAIVCCIIIIRIIPSDYRFIVSIITFPIGVAILSNMSKPPRIIDPKYEFKAKEDALLVYDSVISKLNKVLASSQYWKRKQNINLIRSWVILLRDHKVTVYQIDNEAAFSELNCGIINYKFYQSLSFPLQLNISELYHKLFAINIFDLFVNFNNTTFNYFQNESAHNLREESLLPFPIDYILNISTMVIEWSKLEPNNHKLRPAEAYQAGRTLLFSFPLNK